MLNTAASHSVGGHPLKETRGTAVIWVLQWRCCNPETSALRNFLTLKASTMWKPVWVSKGLLGSAGLRAAAAAVTCLLVTGMLVVTGGHPNCRVPEELPAAGTSGKVFSAYFSKLTRERRAVSGPPRSSDPTGPVERLSPADLFIAVKTTGRYHRQRLELLLDTWISRNMPQVGLMAHLLLRNGPASLHIMTTGFGFKHFGFSPSVVCILVFLAPFSFRSTH